MGRVSARHRLLALLTTLIWGCNFVAIDIGVADVPPLLLVALRFVVVLLPAIFFVHKPPVAWKWIILVGLFMSVGQFSLLYLSLWLGMPAGLASLVLQSQAILTVAIAALALHERPTLAQVTGLTVGIVGLFVVGVGRDAATPAFAFIVTLAAALSWAIGNIVSRMAGSASGLSMTVWSALVVPIPLFLLSLLVDGPSLVFSTLTHLTLAALLSTAYTAYLASLVGYSIWNSLLARYPAGAVTPFSLLIPVFGMAAAWLLLGEQPNTWEVIGGVILLLGVAITTGLLGSPRRSRVK